MTDASASTTPPAAPYAQGAPAKPPIIVWDLVVTILLIVIGIPLLLVAGVFSLMMPMASAPCGGDIVCNDTQFTIGWIVAMAAPLLFIVSAIVAIIAVVRRKLGFWIVLVGGVVTLLVWLGGTMLVVGAVPGTTL